MRVQEFHQVGGIVTDGKLKLEGRKIFEDFLRRQRDGTKLVGTTEMGDAIIAEMEKLAA